MHWAMNHSCLRGQVNSDDRDGMYCIAISTGGEDNELSKGWISAKKIKTFQESVDPGQHKLQPPFPLADDIMENRISTMMVFPT